MVIVHRTIRRLKDTFQCSRSQNDLIRHHRLIGRRILSTKKLRSLPNNRDKNCNINDSQIPLPSLLSSKTSKTNDSKHDAQQSQLKNMVIDELKGFFASRNENNSESHDKRNSERNPSTQVSLFTPEHPVARTKHINSLLSKNQIVQRPFDSAQVKITKEQLTDVILSKTTVNSQQFSSISLSFPTASTTLLVSFSFLTSIILNTNLLDSSKRFVPSLNLLFFYSTSFTFGCFGARWFHQRRSSHINHFGNILTRSLLLYTFLASLRREKIFPQQTFIISGRMKSTSKLFIFTRQDIFTRIITSILHLIAGLTINFHDKDTV